MGRIAFLLMRSRSDRHSHAAKGELRRDFGIDLQVEFAVDATAPVAAVSTQSAEAVTGELLALFRTEFGADFS